MQVKQEGWLTFLTCVLSHCKKKTNHNINKKVYIWVPPQEWAKLIFAKLFKYKTVIQKEKKSA